MLNEIFNKINSANKILILTHVNPDGDTLGSAVCMKEYLGKKADILVQTDKITSIPYNYQFLDALQDAKYLDTIKDEYDLIVALDIASIDRIVSTARKIFDRSRNTICIDHHKTNRGFASINFIKGGYSSTGEVLFEMFEKKGIQITKKMAEGLYVAILTDTGCFKYENVTPKTFTVASSLSKTGIDTSYIAKKCYDNKPKSMITFQADIIKNCKFLFDDRVVYSIITQEKMDKYKVKNEHTEGIVETLRSISNVDISILLKENSDKTTKVSLRSKSCDLTPVVEHFHGGGHKMAAGCTIKKPAKEAIELILDEISKCLN